MHILIEAAPGELIDKITILEIKLEKITDEDKLRNIEHEYNIMVNKLKNMQDSLNGNRQYKLPTKLATLTQKLKAVNLRIWEIEDDIRECERQQQFDQDFVKLARGVYFNNDERCSIKREINNICGSEIIEEKSHKPY